MPSMDGGSSTSREYAPHMYIYGGGDMHNDDSFGFVANSSRCANVGEHRYRMGVDTLGQMVCERHQLVPGSTFDVIWDTCEPVLAEDIPAEVVYSTIMGAIQQHDAPTLNALGVDTSGLGATGVNFDKLFNGTDEESDAERQKIKESDRRLEVVSHEVKLAWKYLGLDGS